MEAKLKAIFKKNQQSKTILPIKEMRFNHLYEITKMERIQTSFGKKIRCLVENNKYIYLPGIYNDTMSDDDIAEFSHNIYYLTKDKKDNTDIYELNIHAKTTGNFR